MSNESHKVSVSEHEHIVKHHYDSMTEGYYLRWNPDHIHFGLFEPGECLISGEMLRNSAKLARALERMIEVVVAPARDRSGPPRGGRGLRRGRNRHSPGENAGVRGHRHQFK